MPICQQAARTTTRLNMTEELTGPVPITVKEKCEGNEIASRYSMQRTLIKGISLRTVAIGAGLCSAAAAAGSIIYALENGVAVEAGEHIVHPYKLPWSHNGCFSSLDYASVRRGYEVYKQVCAACHSMRYLRYRHFVDVFMTEQEAKDEAAEAVVHDINDKGVPFDRPGTLRDPLPSPYPNKKAAAAANNGAVPPDLSLMTMARHGGDDYIFALLTGYFDPPAGVKVDEGKAYNPYFLGGVISMPQQLYDEGIEYQDGTPATQTQQAKDVVTFMRWSAEPHHDLRKRYFMNVLLLTPIAGFVLLYLKRYAWTFLKSQKIIWRTVKGREPPKAS